MGSPLSRLRRMPQSLPPVRTTNPSIPPAIRPPLPALPPEVLLIIFNSAHETAALSVLRIVSRQFDLLIVPIIYRQVTLTAKVVACVQQSTPERSATQLHIAKSICKYTGHVSINKELHWPSVLRLLYSLEKLLDLSISYWPVSLDAEPSIHDCLSSPSQSSKKWPELKLHVESHETSTALPIYTLLTHGKNVISYKTTLWSGNNERSLRHSTLKDALLANPQLERLHILCDEKELNDAKWDKQDTRKLPPVKELVIRDLLGWNIFSVCDWSNVTHLELINISSIALTESVRAEDLSNLKTLIIACDCRDRAQRQDQLQKLSDFLNTLLSYTTNLGKLSLKCGVRDFRQNRRDCSLSMKSEEFRNPNDCISTIAQRCQRLRSLELRNSDQQHSLPWKWILLSNNDLEVIGCGCPGLMELSLDAKIYLYGRQPRLDMVVTAALAAFRNLRRLTVHTLMPYLPPEPGLLPYHQARAIAREWTENVQRLKKGAKFERLTMNIEIERLVVDDEFQRIYDDDDWRVYLNFTCETGNGVSWSVTGEERSLEFIHR